MRKILIMPYFGTLPGYFNLWLKSCSYNKSIDYIVFTDNEMMFRIPENVKWVKISFHEFRNLFVEKLPFKISLKKPYKLCDFRPLYGHILESFISEYDFWGFCDCDTIWGDIGKFLNEDAFHNNDKLLRLGHLSFVRNQKSINRLPLTQSKLKTILGNNVPYAYDEIIGGYYNGFNGALLNNEHKIYFDNGDIADIDYHEFNFKVGNQDINIFRFNKGELNRFYIKDGKVRKQEVMYVHLQKRNMICDKDIDEDNFEIIPNRFKNIENDITEKYICEANQYSCKRTYFDFKREKQQNLSWGLKRLFYEPHKLQAIKWVIKKI